jgi:acyl-CoA synthetase (AMP-forming)/AMP-acid ligase II
MAVIDFFDRGLSMDPRRPFAVDPERAFSWRAASDLSHRIANAFAADEIGPGSNVVVHAPNSALGFVSIIGILRSGAAWITFNYRDGLDSKIAYLQKTRPTAMIFDPTVEHEALDLAAAVPSLRRLVSLGPSQTCPNLETWVCDHRSVSSLGLLRLDQLAVLDGTGGTTGTPKAAMQTHRCLEAMTANVLTAMPTIGHAPVCLVAAPMTHGAGNLAHALMAAGTTNVLLPRFDPDAVLRAIERHRVTHVFLPPTAIYSLLAHERIRRFDYSSLRHLVYGGAPISVDRLREAIDIFGPVLTQIYGQAEACFICTCLVPGDHVVGDPTLEHRLWSCGRPALLTPVGIMDEDGMLLAAGERGEIVVRGSIVMTGYFDDPEATAAVTTNGWHRTGDVGYVDEDGFVFIVDRKKDMIISGGFNVYPAEVERVLLSHPAVRECAVVGTPDEHWGEKVTAVVELKHGRCASEQELIARCKERIGSYKAPKRIEFWPDLPRSANGKVLRTEIRATFWPKDTPRVV